VGASYKRHAQLQDVHEADIVHLIVIDELKTEE
jgi:hypothetical protein